MIKRSAFYKQYKISGAEPHDVVKHRVPVSIFANTVTEFLSTEFSGLVEIDCKPIWDVNSCIRVCEDFAAYFFKNLLAAIYGKDVLKIDIILEDDVFSITLHQPRENGIAYSHINDLSRMAKSAGFDYEITDERLTLFVRTLRYKATGVRSMTQNLLRARFVEIFFTGAPMPDFDGWE